MLEWDHNWGNSGDTFPLLYAAVANSERPPTLATS
jgi:hypothetical protein